MKVTILILFQVANDQSSKWKLFPVVVIETLLDYANLGSEIIDAEILKYVWSNNEIWNNFRPKVRSRCWCLQCLAWTVSLSAQCEFARNCLQMWYFRCSEFSHDELVKISEGSKFCKNINLTQRKLNFSAADGWCTFRGVLEVVFIHTGNLLRIW